MQNELRRFKAEIFQALAHPTRIAIAEALRDGERSAGDLIAALGLEQANASQHLSVLRAKQVVVNRKESNQVFYSLRDPALAQVLDALKEYFYRQLEESHQAIKQLKSSHRAGRATLPTGAVVGAARATKKGVGAK